MLQEEPWGLARAMKAGERSAEPWGRPVSEAYMALPESLSCWFPGYPKSDFKDTQQEGPLNRANFILRSADARRVCNIAPTRLLSVHF